MPSAATLLMLRRTLWPPSGAPGASPSSLYLGSLIRKTELDTERPHRAEVNSHTERSSQGVCDTD